MSILVIVPDFMHGTQRQSVCVCFVWGALRPVLLEYTFYYLVSL